MKKDLDGLLEKVDELFVKLKDGETTNKSVNEYMVVFIGILAELLSSKKLFKRNGDVANFLEKKFGILFADYIKKSRPLMIGRTIKFFLADDEYINIKEHLNELYGFIISVIDGKQDDLTWSDVIKSIKL